MKFKKYKEETIKKIDKDIKKLKEKIVYNDNLKSKFEIITVLFFRLYWFGI